jgi:hypothetical protein
LKSKAKHFISDTFHKNDDFYRIPAKSLSNEGINSNVEKIEADIKTAEVEYSLSNKGEVSKGNDWLAQDSKPVESNSQSIGKEGKTVNIAEKLLPDWEVLKGKDVTIWADNNIAGIKAAAKVKDTLNELNSQNAVKAQIKIVKLPEDLPVKLDLVNKMSEAMSIDRLKDVNTGFDKAKEISANEVKINLTLEKAGSLNQLQKQEKLPHWKDLLEQKLKLPTDNEIFKEQLQALGLKDTFENAGTPVSKFTERLNEVHMEKYGRPIEVLSSQSNNRGSEPSATFTYTSYIEVIADEFISAYKERAFADQHDLLTVLQKEEFKENIKSVAKDKDLISTIKTRNPEVGKEVEALAKSYNREIQQQRGFDLSR